MCFIRCNDGNSPAKTIPSTFSNRRDACNEMSYAGKRNEIDVKYEIRMEARDRSTLLYISVKQIKKCTESERKREREKGGDRKTCKQIP